MDNLPLHAGALLLAACVNATPVPAPVPGRPVAPAPQAQAQPPALRLPTTVRPVREALALHLVPSEPTFSGTATLELQVEAPADHFWMHAQGLTVDMAQF